MDNLAWGDSDLRDWRSHAYSKLCSRLSRVAYQHSMHFYNAVEDEKRDSERRERLLSDAKKLQEKTEKKRLKKKRQKERKLSEKLKKEEEKHVPKEKEANDPAERNAAESKPGHDDVDELAMTIYTKLRRLSSEKSSEEESEGNSEELNLTSAFVSKAADIARRKLEQKFKSEQKAKRSPVRGKSEHILGKVREELPNSVGPKSPEYDVSVRKSAELANTGNQFASAGDYITAVKYFTDAIKYNPTEFKLFGNRSFCFEKMQEYTKALADAELSLSMRPGWVKGLFRKSRALAGLQRFEDAARVLGEVLRVDGACAEATLELKRVQISQLMECGFSKEQSSVALISHGSVEKALEALSQSDRQSRAEHGGSPRRRDNLTEEAEMKLKPSAAVKTAGADHQPPQDLYPIWVGNLVHTITEAMLTKLFKKVGVVHSVKLLSNRHCGFVNFAHKDSCVEAIRSFHGSEFLGCQLVVRYPDRIPQGMGFAKSALKAEDLRDENGGRNFHSEGFAGRRPQRHLLNDAPY
ncbi:uncharacterized protein LOC142894213 [Nelusetta ayraudi]|uniref:uncharacterized protein LOC142894213 n=1 Tax=Nelusetta ayraudi TaxID=303726 RepID=UPI003F7170E9